MDNIVRPVFGASPHCRRSFNPSWSSFGFVEEKDKARCVLCGQDVVFRSSSIKRHFLHRHSATFSSELHRADVVLDAISYYNRFREAGDVNGWFNEIRGNVNKVHKSHSKPTQYELNDRLPKESSFVLAHFLASRGRPLEDAAFVKEAFVECAETLFKDLANKSVILMRLRNIPASVETMKSRVKDMTQSLSKDKTGGKVEPPAYSLALTLREEVSDLGARSGGRLSLGVRFCDGDTVFQELCSSKTFIGDMTGGQVFDFLKYTLRENDIRTKDVFSVATDNSPAFCDIDRGFLTLLEKDLCRTVLKYHCLLDVQALLRDISQGNLNFVVESIGKIVNFLVSNYPFYENLFRPYSERIKLVPLSQVAWLGGGQVVKTLVSNFNAIRKSLLESEVAEEFPELKDTVWADLLMYLTDIVGHLDEFKSSLQGCGATVLDLFKAWKDFIVQIKLLIRDISTGQLDLFPSLKNHRRGRKATTDECLKYTEALMHEFSERLDHLYAYEPVLPFLVEPQSFAKIDSTLFPMINLKDLTKQFEGFKKSNALSLHFANLREALTRDNVNRSDVILKCWNSVPDSFHSVKTIAFTLLSSFGSLCSSDVASVGSPSHGHEPKDDYCPDLKKPCLSE